MNRERSALLLPLALVVCDGMLNALTFASATVPDGRGLGWNLAVRGGVVRLASVFANHVAEHARLRVKLTGPECEPSMANQDARGHEARSAGGP